MFNEKELSVCRSVSAHIDDFDLCDTVSDCEGLYDFITDYLSDEVEGGSIGEALFDLWCFRALSAFSRRVDFLTRNLSRGCSK